MASITKTLDTSYFRIIHPLDDEPEEKLGTEALGPMPMTRSVKWSLLLLRAYLIIMGFLVLYHVLDMAGLFGRAAS